MAVGPAPDGTCLARHDDKFDGCGARIDVSRHGIERKDREFIAAFRERRQPNSSIGDVLDCCRGIGELAS